MRLHAAVLGLDATAYRTAFDRLVELDRLRTTLHQRQTLLARLEATAPGWSRAIRNRHFPHDGLAVLGDVVKAWLWWQPNDELDERNKVSLEALQHEIEQLSKDANRATTELIDRSAWARQLRNSGKHRSDLVG